MTGMSFIGGTDTDALLNAAQLTGEIRPKVTQADIEKAIDVLSRYKAGKTNLEARVVEDEEWYRLRHWEVIRRKKAQDGQVRPEPASAWLFNAIMNKHADANDNFPEAEVLPREAGDQEDARTLSSVLPVVLEQNDFEGTYSQNWWEKLKHGTAVYGAFWNNEKENGLGDIDIRPIDLLNIFWEPGITQIQASRNVFVTDLKDNDLLESEYPQLRGKLQGRVIDVKQYVYDDTVDSSEKSVVVDWYYKVRAPGGRTVLHYCKFVGREILYASENDPDLSDRGFYDHGEYPFIFDILYPEKGTPVGFGYVAIAKDPQMYIDKLGQNILETSLHATRPRYFASDNAGVNEEEFLDWSKPIVHVNGSIEENRLRPMETTELNGVYVNVLQMKIDEMKETAANRDFSSGGTSSGITAAAAIAALQEAGNKSSRDMISTAYRSYSKICYLCIELMRQFYDEARSFRITGQGPGQYEFVDYNNQRLKDQPLPEAYAGQSMEPDYVPGFRRPVFDIRLKVQKKNPYSRMIQNELAKELYGMGMFNPQRAQEALGALELMEFEGKESVVRHVSQGETLMNVVQQMQAQLDKMALALQLVTGRDMGAGADSGPNSPAGGSPTVQQSGGSGMGAKADAAMQAGATPYMANLAQRSKPDMSMPGSGATP